MKAVTVKQSTKIVKDLDWECVDSDTSYATHSFHRYSSKFIPQIASNLINLFSSKGEVVLDPFVGSGTTLVECKILGRNSVGIDLNPLACLISRVKSTNIDESLLQRELYNLLDKVRGWIYVERKDKQLNLYTTSQALKDLKPPTFPYIERWFQPHVIKELSIITEGIRRIKDFRIREFAICALSAIIRGVSNAKSGFGNLMIDEHKRPIENTFEIFEGQLIRMIEGMIEFNHMVDNLVFADVHTGDARNMDFIENNSIDLIVTHPPYIASVPYAEYLKLSMNWLRESLPEMFVKSFGDNMYPRNLDRNIMGGRRGRKDVVERFLKDMRKVLKEMHRVLKKGRYCCIVIGNPVVSGQQIELNNILTTMAKDTGFLLEQEIVRGKYKTTMGKMKEEYILIFRKGY